jgi:hypothetical protein
LDIEKSRLSILDNHRPFDQTKAVHATHAKIDMAPSGFPGQGGVVW